MARAPKVLTVQDFMQTDPVTVTPDTPVSEILGLMRSKDIHEVPVVDGKTVTGLVTMAGIAKRGTLPPHTKARGLVSSLATLTPDADIRVAAGLLLSTGTRALPVLDRKALAGVLSRTDLVRAFLDFDDLASREVHAVMTPNPKAISENATVAEARQAMAALQERSIPVVDAEGHLAGVVGLKDLIALFTRQGPDKVGDLRGEKKTMKVEVQGLMHSPAVTLPPEATLGEAARKMLDHDISSVIIADGHTPVGIVTKLDLIELLASTRKEDGILVQITGLDEQADVYDAVYESVQKSMSRLADIARPRLLNLHVVQHKADGDNSKWSIRARLTTEHGLYYQNHFDWELMTALAGLLEGLETRIKDDKDRRVSDRRRRPAHTTR